MISSKNFSGLDCGAESGSVIHCCSVAGIIKVIEYRAKDVSVEHCHSHLLSSMHRCTHDVYNIGHRSRSVVRSCKIGKTVG